MPIFQKKPKGNPFFPLWQKVPWVYWKWCLLRLSHNSAQVENQQIQQPFLLLWQKWYCKNFILQIWTKLGNKHWINSQPLFPSFVQICKIKFFLAVFLVFSLSTTMTKTFPCVFLCFRFEYSNFLCYSSTFAIVEKCHSELPLSCHLMGVVPTYFKLLDFFNYHPLHTSCDIFFVRITNKNPINQFYLRNAKNWYKNGTK